MLRPLSTRHSSPVVVLLAVSLSLAPSAFGAQRLHADSARATHRQHHTAHRRRIDTSSNRKGKHRPARKLDRTSSPPTYTASFTPTAAATLFGESAVQSQRDYLSAGHAEAFRFRAATNGTASTAYVYLDLGTTARTVIVGIYGEGRKHPGTLLGIGTIARVTAGAWNAVPLGGTPVTLETNYWLAILSEGGTLRFRDQGNGPCPSEESARGSLSGLPSTWSTGSQWHDCPVSAYVTGAQPPVLAPPPPEPIPAPETKQPTESPTPTETPKSTETTPPEPPAESSPPPPPPPPSPPTNIELPAIAGTSTEGQTLTATSGTWLGTPTSYTYQWQDCAASGTACAAIPNASAAIYTLAPSDVAHTVRVTVTATNLGGSTSASSVVTSAVAAQPPAAPTNTAMPAVSGTTTQGDTLSAANGSWTGNPTSYTYQWRDCSSSGSSCASIEGATSPTYRLAAGDVSHTMRVRVTAANAGGSSSMSSPATEVVAAEPPPLPSPPTNTAPPAIGGTTTEGHTLSATTGTWTENPASYTYQWQDCNESGAACASIEGATAPTHMLVATDVGHALRVTVTASNAGGSAQASSLATATVAAEPPPPPSAPTNTAPPTIGGTTTEGQTLTATTGTWTGGPTSYTYQWEDCNSSGAACTSIEGALAATYVLGAGDVNGTLRVAVTATNAGGSTQASSMQSAIVAEKPSEAAGCSVVVSGVSQINGALKAGAVVCLAAGTYGQVSITTTPASNATLTAAPGAHVVVGGVNIAASNITVSQLHSTGAINVGSGSPYPGFSHDVIEHNDVGPTNGYGISVMSATSTPSSYITIKGNRIHDTSTTSEGDALRFDGWNNITVAENDIYNIKECASDTCHTDTLQSYNGNVPTTGLTLTRNYTHDNVGAQGLPFLKDGDISNVTITDNLSLHNTNTNGQVTGIWVNENINNLTITNNTYQETSGSIVQADGSAKNPTVNINHNVFDNLNVRPGTGPSYTITEDYNIFTQNDEYTFNLGPHSTINTKPLYQEPTTSNYQLTNNPNNIGINWHPTQQQYGPTN